MEELLKRLDVAAAALAQTFNVSNEFLVEALEQWVTYTGTMAIIYVAIALFVLVAISYGGRVFRKSCKDEHGKVPKHENDAYVSSILIQGIFVILGVIVLVLNVSTAIKACVAPKLMMLEKISSVMRGY
jgi:hypothetical protein